MPPVVRFNRESVLDAAYRLVRNKGVDGLNARAVAKELGGSTQPIFRIFANMGDMYQALIEYVSRDFQQRAEEAMEGSDAPYIQLCITYLLYARDEPELFKLLFMRDRLREGEYNDQTHFDLVFNIIKAQTTLNGEDALHFFERTWLFIHGLATCMATKYIPSPDEDYLMNMVKESYNAAIRMMGLEEKLKWQE